MYERSTTASRRVEQKARERLVHCSVGFLEVKETHPETGVVTKKFVKDVAASKGTYIKPKE